MRIMVYKDQLNISRHNCNTTTALSLIGVNSFVGRSIIYKNSHISHSSIQMLVTDQKVA